jgi:hypothetical protein
MSRATHWAICIPCKPTFEARCSGLRKKLRFVTAPFLVLQMSPIFLFASLSQIIEESYGAQSARLIEPLCQTALALIAGKDFARAGVMVSRALRLADPQAAAAAASATVTAASTPMGSMTSGNPQKEATVAASASPSNAPAVPLRAKLMAYNMNAVYARSQGKLAEEEKHFLSAWRVGKPQLGLLQEVSHGLLKNKGGKGLVCVR